MGWLSKLLRGEREQGEDAKRAEFEKRLRDLI
jgi:hypothetical protein